MPNLIEKILATYLKGGLLPDPKYDQLNLKLELLLHNRPKGEVDSGSFHFLGRRQAM